MKTIKSWIASLLAVCAVASVAIAHDDDGKIRDRQKPYRGPGWREVDGKKNDGSVAGSFDSNGIQLRSWLPLASLSAASTSGNSCWGYISPAGREYGIIGTSDGTAFVEITNPGAAALKAFIVGPTSLWRDVRVYGQYCYAASEGGSGIQVMDMSQLDATNTVTLVNTILAPTTTTAASHTLAIDTVSGYLYRAGGGANGLGITANGFIGGDDGPGAKWQVKGTGDFDGDGHSDILMQYADTGACFVWQMGEQYF